VSSHAVLESTVAARTFEIDQKSQGELPMVYAPQGQTGNFFNRQERNVRSFQLVEALTFSKDDWLGQHVFKVGLDLQHSRFDGDAFSQEVDAVRFDGSLAERTTYSPPLTHPEVNGTEFALFAQDRWRVSDRLIFELGIRSDRDDIVEQINYSPRVGMSISLLPEGRGILRGGFGKFSERTPLTVGAFTQYDVQTVSRFASDGTSLGAPVTFVHVTDTLKTPESIVQTVAWDQRFGRRFFFKSAYLHRNGSHAYTLNPDPSRGVLTLGSVGESKYWELETTGRFLASEYRDLSVSYVRSKGTRDLNDYDQFFGNFRNPIIRSNANSLSPTDVPNRLIVRGTIGLPGKWVFTPLYEWRSGFPWSAVDEFQDFVGTRNEAGRLPTVSTLDFSLVRNLRFKKWRFSGGIKIYNALNTGNERDVQNNTTSPDFGKFYNPIQRSIGFVVGSAR
jgi:TonB-dependent receptor-like protein